MYNYASTAEDEHLEAVKAELGAVDVEIIEVANLRKVE